MKNNLFVRLLVRIYIFPFQVFSWIFLRRKKMTILTGADSKFFHSMLQLINSINIHEKGNYKIIAYDLGLSDAEIFFFKWRNPTVELKKFDFSKYPSHYNINENAGAYAWKPQIIFDEFRIKNDDDFLFWLDAGCIVRRQLLVIRAALYFYGFYSVLSGVLIKDYTVEKTINLLNLKQNCNLKMLSGGVIGFEKENKKNTSLIFQWSNAARSPEIICPHGSNCDNHRFDQSIISLLFYKIYDTKNQPIISKKGLEIITHKYIG